MKIQAEVLAVETNGDHLAIRYQGSAKNSAKWRNLLHGTIRVDDTASSRKAYHVGRTFTMIVEPRP